MLALIYLLIVLIIGHILCRRFFHFDSLPHRLAADFLVGLVVSTFATYLFALAFAWTNDPLLYGNLLFGIVSIAIIVWFFRRWLPEIFSIRSLLDDPSTDKWDWVYTAIFFVISCWLMFGTFGLGDGNLRMGSFLWNDFGPNLSLIQSFAIGRNFPTEYPHFIGEPIRYHFLFWFQAGNLEFLGLNIAWSLNLLSALTMTVMLTLIATLGHVVFGSKAVGRIGAILFLFHGTLSYIPFLWSKSSPTEAFYAVINASEWLKSIYTYSGEQWGIWSLGTVLAQRHLPPAIGIFLVVLIFLIEQVAGDTSEPLAVAGGLTQVKDNSAVSDGRLQPSATADGSDRIFPYGFSGVLLGLLPLWNGAVYVASFAVIGSLLILFPNRLRMLCLLGASAVIAIPQILFLKAGTSRGFAELFRFGYVVEPPSIENVFEYFSFTFGVKTLLALIALAMLTTFHRRLFLAFFSLVVLAFGTQLSTDVMNNHKFLNVWLLLINLFSAYTLWHISRVKTFGKVGAAVLFLIIALGGTIELLRIHNDNLVDVPFNRGGLYEWLYAETEPGDIFLTDKYIHHPIFLSGRKVFYGWPYFGWSMGYPTGKRDEIYRRLFEEKKPVELRRLLAENKIKYVGIDNGLRNGWLRANLNEAVYDANFPKAFVDNENKYGSLVIYKILP